MITVTKRWIISSCLLCVKGTEILRVRIPFLLESSEQESVKVETQRHKDAQGCTKTPPRAAPAYPRSPSILTPAPRKAGHPRCYSPRKGLQSPGQEVQTNLSCCQPNSCQIPPEWGRRWGLCGWFDACLSRIPPLSESMEVSKMTPERAGPTAVMEHSPGVGGSPGRWGQGLGRLRVSRRSAGGPGASTLSGNRLQMTKMEGGKGGQGRRSPEDLRGRGAGARGGRHKGGPGGGEGWRRGLAPLSPVCFGRASS